MRKKWLVLVPAVLALPPVLYVGMLSLTLMIASADNASEAAGTDCQPTWNESEGAWEWPGGVVPLQSPTPSPTASDAGSGSGSSSGTSEGAGAGATPAPSSSPGVIDDSTVVAGYDAEQLTNALYIVTAATEMELGANAQILGVMTAMGESSLINIDYGDNAINPDGSVADSIGLFQQQHWKGTVEERMDPTTSATIFYNDLIAVEGWDTLEPTIAIHRTQGNSDPYHYERYYDDAVEIVEWVSGQDLSAISHSGRSGACTAGTYTATGSEPGPWGGYSNGQIPEYELDPVEWNTFIWLRPDATAALTELNAAYLAEFDRDLPLNDGYRPLEEQIEAKEIYGDEAAEPGTSIHGWGLAIDVGTITGDRLPASSETFTWLVENAGKYGWVNPPWAVEGGAGPYEPWHWEYWGKSE